MGQRKTPTPEQLRIWREYTETSQLVHALLEARMQRDSAMSTADYRVLLALTEAPERTLRSSRLAELIDWERSRLSHHLGRMEKRGLIRRTRRTDDAHAVDVTVTAVGRDAFRSGSVPHLRAVREVFIDALTPEQLAHLGEIASALRSHLEAD